MFFDTLDAALDAIDALQDYNLDRLIKRYGINCQYSSMMPERVYGFSLPLTNTMFINGNVDFTERIKAHEFIHCLIDDSASPLVESTYVNNSKIEARANQGGFYLMIKEYLSLTDIDPKEFNILTFSEQCHIPAKYIYTAGLAAEKVFNVKYTEADYIAD
ncbi:hypothetical protein DA798_08620 [Lactobacillus sp. PFC-70]|nr:hypothetical protein DA798_08620 [Lactobacillus sp. PFC-70]